jgi:hypothetical protein
LPAGAEKPWVTDVMDGRALKARSIDAGYVTTTRAGNVVDVSFGADAGCEKFACRGNFAPSEAIGRAFSALNFNWPIPGASPQAGIGRAVGDWIVTGS